MNAEGSRRDVSLERLLEAGRQAFTVGNRRAAHDYWRMAAVRNPYEERVWVALMNVLTDDDDREVCLENIIAINPLNPEARRALRTIRHSQRTTQEIVRPLQPITTPKPVAAATVDDELPDIEKEPRKSPRLMVAIVTGVSIGLVAVLLGVAASIAVYGGLVIRVTP